MRHTWVAASCSVASSSTCISVRQCVGVMSTHWEGGEGATPMWACRTVTRLSTLSTALQLAMRAPFVNQNKTFQLASRVESSLLPKSFVLFSALTINLMLCFIWFAISIVVVVAVGITVTITVAAPARSVESVEELQLVAVVVVVVLSCGSTWMLILCRHLMRPNELLMKLTARQGVSAHRHAHMQGTHVRLPCHKLKCQNIYSL